MDFIWESITEWLKEVLVGGIMDHLSGMFDAVNQQVGDVATQVGTSILLILKPGFSSSGFSRPLWQLC